MPLLPRRRWRAATLGRYRSSASTCSTRERVGAVIAPLPLTTFETVLIDTPARSATSCNLTRATAPPSVRSPPQVTARQRRLLTGGGPLRAGRPSREQPD